MAKGIGDILKKQYGFEVDETPEPINEALKKYVQELYTEDRAKEQAKPWEVDKVFNTMVYFAEQKLKTQGKSFAFDNQNEPFIKFMALYFANDERVNKWSKSENHKLINSFSFQKGLLLAGSYGLGKSLMFSAASQAQIPENRFGITTTNSAVQQYEADGPKYLNQFFTGNRCFDDFGTESKAWHYGKQVDIFKTILEERYNTFINKGIKTHISTNLTIDEISKRYGERVESRLYEMFNIVILTGKDRRKHG
jgi:DNA replication protein DnaC